jgi:Mrp family chromosome partitioning ATPase
VRVLPGTVPDQAPSPACWIEDELESNRAWNYFSFVETASSKVMSRNFSLLQIVGKDQEYFQTENEAGAPVLASVPAPPAEVKAFPAVTSPEQPLRFEMETWQLEELTKLVHGVFLAPGAESNRGVSNRCVVLASTESGNGCSWICARAGELLASQVAGRVCLVDANFGRPTLHEHFGVANHSGLSDALQQEGSMGGYVSQLSRRNLVLVSAGSAVSRDLTDKDLAQRVRERLQELRADFDYVLIDGASLDAGDESIALAGAVDGIVLVLKTQSTRKERTRGRVQELKAAGVRILGAVLNQPA